MHQAWFGDKAHSLEVVMVYVMKKLHYHFLLLSAPDFAAPDAEKRCSQEK